MVGQTLFVDPVNGNDATAQRQRLDLPYRSILNAVNDMQDGDEIILLPGNHLVPFTVTLPNYDQLSITSWGGREVTFITPPADNTPAFSRTFGPPAPGVLPQRWRFEGFTCIDGTSYTFDIGDTTVDRFVGASGLLEFESVTMDAMRLRRLGRVRVTNCISGTASQIIGCSDVTLQSSRFDELALWFRNAGNNYQTALGRIAYRLVGCDVTDLMDIQGAPAVYIDRSTTVQELQASVGTAFLTPVLSLQGSLGVSASNQFSGAVSALGTALSITFSADPFILEAGVRPGLDLSYAHIYGDATIVLNDALVLPFDPAFFMVGGNHARFLGNLTVSAPNNLVTPFYADFRNSEFLPTSVLVAAGVEVDITGAAFNELNLNTVGALAAYYRKYAATAGSPLAIGGGGTVGNDLFAAPFGSVVLGPPVMMAYGSGDTLASQPMSLSASLTAVSYEVTSDVGSLSLFGATHG